MRLGSAIKEFSDRLERAGVFSPEKDTHLLVAHALGIDEEQLTKTLDSELSAEKIVIVESVIGRREKREPLHRILGSMFFCGLKINVTDNVFRPCHEIESLVEVAVAIFEKKKNEPIRILDLGTGTGCILLALLDSFPNATGIGVDIEEHILEAARKNAEETILSQRADFRLSDWGSGLNEPFDLIICNPPAIATNKIPFYPPEMRDYNPLASIDGGEDGLSFYKSIAADFGRLTKSDAIGVFRAYSHQQEASIFRTAGLSTKLVTDYLGEPYCILVANDLERPLPHKG